MSNSIKRRIEKIEARYLPKAKESSAPEMTIEEKISLFEGIVTAYRRFFGETVDQPPAGATMSELERHWGGQFARAFTDLYLSHLQSQLPQEDDELDGSGRPDSKLNEPSRLEQIRQSDDPMLIAFCHILSDAPWAGDYQKEA